MKLDRGWSLWPVFEVRGAGFEVAALQPLAAERTAAALEGERALQAEVAAARTRAMDLLNLQRKAGAPTANKLMERVRKHHRGLTFGDAGIDAALQSLDGLRDRLDAAQQSSAAAFARDAEDATRALKGWLDDPKFRRALLLQNRSALKGGLEAWRRGGDERTARRAQLAIATYLFRYTTKNDTVGFFGPVGWGRFTDDGAALTQHAGPALVEHVSVHLEPWAVAALADALTEKMGKSLVPAVSPRILVQGDEVHGIAARSLRGTRPLPDSWKVIFQRLAAPHPPTLEALCADPLTEKAVEAMVEQNVLDVRLPVTAHLKPHARLTGPEADALEQARAAVEAAFDDEPALDAALGALDAQFGQLTGAATTRNPGQTYGSRTLTYANCRRGHQLQLGADIAHLLAQPLTLLLQSARWFTWEAARAFLGELDTLHRDLSARLQTDDVPMVDVYTRLVALFEQQPPAFLARTRRALESKWAQVLQLDGGVSRQALEQTDAFAWQVARTFAAPHPGLPLACHHSPDVLLFEANGQWQAVIGETHAGVNTLGVLQAVDMHPAPDELRRLFRRDAPGPCVSELQHDDYSLCAHDSLLDATDFHLDTGSRYSSWLPPERTLRLCDFTLSRVRDPGPELAFFRCTHRPTGRVWDVLQLLEKMLRLNLTTEFHLPALSPHSPRVTLGRVVLARESWTLERADVLPLFDAHGLDRLRAAFALRHRRQLPRWVFAKIPSEHKPLCVDLQSPVSLDVFCKMAHDAATLRLSEMLPLPQDAWLLDAEGRRYVSELRVVAVDPSQWRPIPIPEPTP